MSIRIHHHIARVAIVAAGILAVVSALALAAPQAHAATPKVPHAGHALHRGVTLRGVNVHKPGSTRNNISIVWVIQIGTGSATCYYSDGSPASEGEQAMLMVSYTGSDGETHWITTNFECGSDGRWHQK